jgi:uracil-DNA glycosylase
VPSAATLLAQVRACAVCTPHLPLGPRPVLQIHPAAKFLIAAQALDERAGLTHAVLAWRRYWPKVIPLPHPSPTNNGWLAHNAWYERELVPRLRHRIAEILRQSQ